MRAMPPAAIKYEGLNHLDEMLEQFEEKFTGAAARSSGRPIAQQARDYILKVCRAEGRAVDRQIQGDDQRGNPPQ